MTVPQLEPDTSKYADGIIVMIVETAKEIGGEPDINKALAALAYSEAYLLAKLDPKDRIAARRTLIEKLDEFIRDFVNDRITNGKGGSTN